MDEIKQLENKLEEMKRLEKEKRLDKVVYDSNHNIDFNLDILQEALIERLCAKFNNDPETVACHLGQFYLNGTIIKPPSYFHNGRYIEYSTTHTPSLHENHTLYCLVKIFKILNMMNKDIKVLKETMI